MASYEITDIEITGTPANPQTINYSSLTDVSGNVLPVSFTGAPIVSLTGVNGDVIIYFPSDPKASSFTVSRGSRYIPGVPPIIYASFKIIGTPCDISARRYYITNVEITGTPASPQTINYSDLTDTDGVSLPVTFSDTPIINIVNVNGDFSIYFPSDPTTTSFTISRGTRFVPGVPPILYVDLEIIDTTGTAAIISGIIPAETMADLLAFYLGDDKRIMINSIKASLLNIGQLRLINRLERHTLSELDITLLEQTVDSVGGVNMNGFIYDIFEGALGIDGVRLTGEKFCRLISFHEWSKYENLSKTFNVDKPVYYVRNNKIYPKPATVNSTQVDVYYTKKPQTITLNDNSEDNVDCELSAKKQIAVIGMACEKFVNRTDEAKLAYEEALEIINELNNLKPPTDSNIYNIDRFKGEQEYTGYGAEEAGFTVNVQRYELP